MSVSSQSTPHLDRSISWQNMAAGLICLAMERERVETLGLPLMEKRNEKPARGRLYPSLIEAREGVTTQVFPPMTEHAYNPRWPATRNMMQHISQPQGIFFPLMARDGGTLVRAGHAEAVVDIARAAGEHTCRRDL